MTKKKVKEAEIALTKKEGKDILAIVMHKKALKEIIDALITKHANILASEQKWWSTVIEKYKIECDDMRYTVNHIFTKIILAKDQKPS